MTTHPGERNGHSLQRTRPPRPDPLKTSWPRRSPRRERGTFGRKGRGTSAGAAQRAESVQDVLFCEVERRRRCDAVGRPRTARRGPRTAGGGKDEPIQEAQAEEPRRQQSEGRAPEKPAHLVHKCAPP